MYIFSVFDPGEREHVAENFLLPILWKLENHDFARFGLLLAILAKTSFVKKKCQKKIVENIFAEKNLSEKIEKKFCPKTFCREYFGPKKFCRKKMLKIFFVELPIISTLQNQNFCLFFAILF